MTCDVHRRAELCSIDSQAKAKQITAAFAAKAAFDQLLSIGVDHIQLSRDQGLIDVANHPGGLLAALEEAFASRRDAL